MNRVFLKNIFTLVSGTAIAQLIAILAIPILTRLYSPEDFGLLATVVTISAFVATFSTLSYESAIVLEGDRPDAMSLVKLCFMLAFVISIAAGLLSLVYFGIENWPLSLFSMFTALLLSFSNIWWAYANMLVMYKVISKSQIIKSLIVVLSQLLIANFYISEYGLIIGNITGILISVIVLFATFDIARVFKESNYDSIKRVIKKYKAFPFYTAPQNLTGYFLDNFPIFIIGFLYSPATLGFYFLSKKMVQIPGGILGAAVKRVFYREAAILTDNGKFLELKALYKKMVLYLSSIIFVPILLMFMYSLDIFVYIFGSEWSESGNYAKWMVLSFGALFVMAPTRVLFLIFKKQKQLLGLDLGIGILSSSSFVIVNYYFSLLDAVAVFSTITAICYILIIVGWFVFFKKNKFLKLTL